MTNLELDINFVDDEVMDELMSDIVKVLEKHGYTEFSKEMDSSEVKVVFYPKESTSF
jgi:hypothetical protein